jgi:uncharacterized protein YdcH (DUF465 family)
MFEHDQEIVHQLLSDNRNFRHLYDKHNTLKEKVQDAEVGINPVDDLTLGALKKEKLLAKDRMAIIIEGHRAL